MYYTFKVQEDHYYTYQCLWPSKKTFESKENLMPCHFPIRNQHWLPSNIKYGLFDFFISSLKMFSRGPHIYATKLWSFRRALHLVHITRIYARDLMDEVLIYWQVGKFFSRCFQVNGCLTCQSMCFLAKVCFSAFCNADVI